MKILRKFVDSISGWQCDKCDLCRQKLRTFNIEIQLEPGAGAGGGRGRSEAGAGPRTVPVSAEAVARKNGISGKERTQ